MLNWIQQFDTFCFLDSLHYIKDPGSKECIAAAGRKRQLQLNAGTALARLQDFINEKQSWLFGHLGYDLKNEIEVLGSSHPDGIGFPDLCFFEPETVIEISANELIIFSDDAERVYDQVMKMEDRASPVRGHLNIQSRITRSQYIRKLGQLKEHIHRGDCYEINFCQEFFANDAQPDPVDIFRRLCIVSPNPFSALYRLEDKWLICASPERFLKKTGDRIFSQPIKGTSPRDLMDPGNDEAQKQSLFHSSKDRSENVMVVDLVRNDLSKVCVEGTVAVDELYGIYSFPQVHQMISTVSGTLKQNTTFSEIIRACFPMGSMTGAPKKKVMELIEKYEQVKRGLFSGSVGYIEPGGDFDFNVIIRSILYNSTAKYLSFQAGSGITFYSDAEKEWEECLLKAAAIKKVLEDPG